MNALMMKKLILTILTTENLGFLLLIGFVLLKKYFINFFRPMTNKTRINFCFKIGALVEDMLLIKILSDCLL